MSIKSQAKRLLKNPKLVLVKMDNLKFINLDDKKYLEIIFKDKLGYKLNLENPKTFNEKLQWLKLYNRNPLYTKLVDKYEVKKYIKQTIGEEYIIPTLGIYDSFDQIDFSTLPNQFVIKCTHDSGGVIICKDKKNFDITAAKNKIEKNLKTDFYRIGREWPYKDVKPRILIEKYMEDKKSKELRDYKFYCFNGKCDYTMLCCGRSTGNTKFYYYDKNWILQKKFSQDGIKDNPVIEKPKNLDKMFKIAEKLSEGIKFVRVDLYNIEGKIYCGELTFYPTAGYDDTRPKDIEDYLERSLKI